MRTSASHSSASGHTGRSNGQTEVAAHACASMCDEMVVLWRLAVLDPTMSPQRYSFKLLIASRLCTVWHNQLIMISFKRKLNALVNDLFKQLNS